MQKIISHLWFDREAAEAANFYVSTFPNSRVKSTSSLEGTPSGSVDVVTFDLIGREFQAISAGPEFKFNPSISFHITCTTPEEVDRFWEQLSQGGQALVPLGEYPFSERFAWVEDRYGLSWQIMLVRGEGVRPKITPVFMFVRDVVGKAEEAIHFWTSVFPESSIQSVQYYGPGAEPDREGSLQYGAFTLAGLEFGAMDSAQDHRFDFNEAISLLVRCDTQEEIDRYWEQLSAVPEAEQCGWLKDRYGVSWQIVPAVMGEMLSGNDRARIDRVTQAFLPMKKLDIAELKAAYEGR